MKNKRESIYLVGDRGPEHNEIASVHKTYNSALKAWNILRISLINDAKRMLKYTKDEAKKHLKNRTWYDEKKLSKESIEYFKNIAKNGNEIYLEIKKTMCHSTLKCGV